MVEISASLLAADYAQLGHEVERAESAGVNSFHFDMMDGHYVPNLAFTPQHLTTLRSYTHHPFYAHLELANSDEVLSKFAALDADMIIVQKDTLPTPEKTFEKITKLFQWETAARSPALRCRARRAEHRLSRQAGGDQHSG